GQDHGGEKRQGDAVEDGLGPLHLAIPAAAQELDALLDLPGDVDHLLLVRADDLESREVAAPLGRHLDEDVDRIAQEDALAGDDAVQLGERADAQRHGAGYHVRQGHAGAGRLADLVEVRQRALHGNVDDRIDRRVPRRTPCVDRHPTPPQQRLQRPERTCHGPAPSLATAVRTVNRLRVGLYVFGTAGTFDAAVVRWAAAGGTREALSDGLGG